MNVYNFEERDYVRENPEIVIEFMARDKDGKVYGYTGEPKVYKDRGEWHHMKGCATEMIPWEICQYIDWKYSLQKVGEVNE